MYSSHYFQVVQGLGLEESGNKNESESDPTFDFVFYQGEPSLPSLFSFYKQKMI